MSACAARRFGPGTPCTKTETSASAELEAKLAQLKAARNDTPTYTPTQESTQSAQNTDLTKNTLFATPIFVPKVGTRGF